MDDEPVFVDESEPGEGLREGGAAVGDQVAAWLALELGDLLAEVAAGDARFCPVGGLQCL